jgi:lysophospholipase L1-like esterase
MAMEFVPAADPRLSYYSPQPVDRSAAPVRLERFPRSAYEALKGQIGPLANLRSSSGCAVVLRTDSPEVVLHLDDLRHHQLVPVGVACEVEGDAGEYAIYSSPDLRELARSVEVRFATGMERGDVPRTVSLWLPVISTCAVAGVSVTDGSEFEAVSVPEPRWLAIGDSLTQGFSVQCPTQNWVHRLARRWKVPAWNLGVGGLRIEPGVFEWALGLRSWDLVTIGLGSNHSWREVDAERAADAAAELAQLVMAGGHRRVVWLLPPYKPCEEGKGPGDFAGVPLTRETGERVRRVRESLRTRLCEFEPGLEVVDGLLPHDARYYPDGLHPFAVGFARMAENLARAIEPVEI